MTRTLITGGSGFIATHVLESFLQHGHSVVTTVRSQEKAQRIKEAFSKYGEDKLSFAIVEDIAKEGAFDKAVVSDPPFKTVIHTASPFHFNATDIKRDLLDPAVIGTTGILKAIQAHAPTVTRVVITSSFAALVDPKGKAPGYVYSEKDWNPVTAEEALANPNIGYRASKTFAEKAAWDFVAKNQPNFSIATMNPPLVFGPVMHHLTSLSSLNTSNTLVRDMLDGKHKSGLQPNNVLFWVDVRDLALAHVRAAEREEAGGKRFFVVAGGFSNEEVAKAILKAEPAAKDKLPEDLSGGKRLEGAPGFDNSRTVNELGIKYRDIYESIADTAKSLEGIPN